MHGQFLKEDLNRAANEGFCVYVLCMKVAETVHNGEFYKAEEHLMDAIKSVNELKRLKDKKETQDRMQAFADHMNKKGISVETVRRVINE